MESISMAPTRRFAERLGGAWRGEESFAWTFWFFSVLCGFALGFVSFVVSLPLLPFADTGLAGFPDTAIGRSYTTLSALVFLGHQITALIMMARCVSNVSWKGWEYIAMMCLIVAAYFIVERTYFIVERVQAMISVLIG